VEVRPAGPEDAPLLRDLERAANLVALAHVFPPDRFPFPDDAVLARWALVLDEPGVTTELGLVGGDPVAFVSYDATTLRHLGVHPDHWGSGLAGLLVARAVLAIGPGAVLWCLEDNHRARGLYEHLGWRPTGRLQETPWPPYPTELEYAAP